MHTCPLPYIGYNRLRDIIFANTYLNADPTIMAKTITNYYNESILTNYELEHGLYADINQACVRSDTVSKVTSILIQDHCSIIFSSPNSTILFLKQVKGLFKMFADFFISCKALNQSLDLTSYIWMNQLNSGLYVF